MALLAHLAPNTLKTAFSSKTAFFYQFRYFLAQISLAYVTFLTRELLYSPYFNILRGASLLSSSFFLSGLFRGAFGRSNAYVGRPSLSG